MDYMNMVPSEFEKIGKEIDKSTDLYNIMEQFKYKFSEEDIRRRWLVYGGPNEVLKLIDTQKNQLENEKIKFLEKMETLQEDFRKELDECERSI